MTCAENCINPPGFFSGSLPIHQVTRSRDMGRRSALQSAVGLVLADSHNLGKRPPGVEQARRRKKKANQDSQSQVNVLVGRTSQTSSNRSQRVRMDMVFMWPERGTSLTSLGHSLLYVLLFPRTSIQAAESVGLHWVALITATNWPLITTNGVISADQWKCVTHSRKS